MSTLVMDKLKTCRCCVKEIEFEEELHAFNSEVAIDPDPEDPQNFIKISDCYMEVTLMNVVEEDEDSMKICSACLGDLKFSYLFKMKCIESTKIFEQDIQCIEEETNDMETSLKTEEEPFEYVVEEHVELMNEDTEDTDGEGTKSQSSYVHSKRTRIEIIESEENSTYSCELCPKTFDRKEYYRRHFRRAHTEYENSEEKPLIYQCDLCGKISTSIEDHEAHSFAHEGEARFKCKKCSEHFRTKEEAKEHLTAAHPQVEVEKNFACEHCPKSFKNRYQLVLHNRSHTGEKPFQCPICERAFSMSSNLQKHLDTHSTDKPYQCNYCNQVFKTQRSLKFHTVCYHQPEAKVKCPQCDKSFVNKSYLKVHMLYHTGEKNFTCTICNSKYYKSSHLKRHIQNVHLKLRLMKCDYCASDFVRKETYKAHIISHHKQQLSEEEFLQVLEKIRKFQAPHLDINQFTVEKQGLKSDGPTIQEEVLDEGEMEEIIEDESMEPNEEYEIYEEEEQ